MRPPPGPPIDGPMVSAIIPAYNCAGTIARAVESIRAQTYPHIEIVICNDGSTDDTACVVAGVAPDAVYLEQENAGPSAARNAAAAAASGELLAMLDADDRWEPEKTTRQLEVLAAEPDVGALATNGFTERDGRRQLWTRAHGPRLREMTVQEQLRGDLRPISASVMIRADLFRALGGYDTSIVRGEDLDLFLRLVASGHRLLYLNEPLYHYVRISGSITSHGIRGCAHDLLRVVQRLDPAVEHEGYRSPLTQREFSAFFGERLLRLAWAEIGAGEREAAAAYLKRIGDLPDPPLFHRFMVRLAARAWTPGKALLAVNRRLKAIVHYWRRWGPIGGLRAYCAGRSG